MSFSAMAAAAVGSPPVRRVVVGVSELELELLPQALIGRVAERKSGKGQGPATAAA